MTPTGTTSVQVRMGGACCTNRKCCGACIAQNLFVKEILYEWNLSVTLPR